MGGHDFVRALVPCPGARSGVGTGERGGHRGNEVEPAPCAGRSSRFENGLIPKAPSSRSDVRSLRPPCPSTGTRVERRSATKKEERARPGPEGPGNLRSSLRDIAARAGQARPAGDGEASGGQDASPASGNGSADRTSPRGGHAAYSVQAWCPHRVARWRGAVHGGPVAGSASGNWEVAGLPNSLRETTARVPEDPRRDGAHAVCESSALFLCQEVTGWISVSRRSAAHEAARQRTSTGPCSVQIGRAPPRSRRFERVSSTGGAGRVGWHGARTSP